MVLRHCRPHDGAGSRVDQCAASLRHSGKPLREHSFRAQATNAQGIARWSMATNHMVCQNS